MSGIRVARWQVKVDIALSQEASKQGKVKTTTALARTKPSVKPITTSMSFCHSIFRVYCHVWVKLRAEQFCGFCTSRSPIVCGKLPLQLIFSSLMRRLSIFISKCLLQWRRCTCTEQKKVAIWYMEWNRPMLTVGSERASQSKTVSRSCATLRTRWSQTASLYGMR